MDKNLLQITGFTAVIIGFLWCFTIIGIFIGIPLILGGCRFIDYSKLSDNLIIKDKHIILNWSIFFLIFAMIPGILGLIFYAEMNSILNKKEPSYIEELRSLRTLVDQGIITKAEFETRKQKILEK